MTQGQKPVCEVCVRIRWFMAIAIPLVLLIGTKSELPLPKIPLHDIAASGILFALVIVFAWRYYEHMRDKKALARLLERKAHHQQETTEDSQTP
jgi:disulfide bond formation protein DsbB